HRLVSANDGVAHPLAATRAQPLRLAPSQNSLRVEVELPSFDNAMHHRYQIFLEGNDAAPPEFSSNAFREITNLPPGSYAIKIAARDATGHTYAAEEYHFVLAAPWYQRPWAYALYLGAAGAPVAASVLFYNRAQITQRRPLH